MSWSPILCFISHNISGFEWWYATEALLKHIHVFPFIRFLLGIIAYSGLVYNGYLEHILCDIQQDLTKSQLHSLTNYLIFTPWNALSMIILIIYYFFNMLFTTKK